MLIIITLLSVWLIIAVLLLIYMLTSSMFTVKNIDQSSKSIPKHTPVYQEFYYKEELLLRLHIGAYSLICRIGEKEFITWKDSKQALNVGDIFKLADNYYVVNSVKERIFCENSNIVVIHTTIERQKS